MILVIVYLVISFLLDGLISNYLSQDSIFLTIYSLVALVIVYRYFDSQKKYLLLLVIGAILFDIIYTKTIGLNVVVFLVIYYLNRWLNYTIPNNMLSVSVKGMLAIISYHSLSFLLLLVAGNNLASIDRLLNILLRSVIMTIIYSIISYLIFNKYYFKIYEKKIK